VTEMCAPPSRGPRRHPSGGLIGCAAIRYRGDEHGLHGHSADRLALNPRSARDENALYAASSASCIGVEPISSRLTTVDFDLIVSKT
jgi:hypothetical protein